MKNKYLFMLPLVYSFRLNTFSTILNTYRRIKFSSKAEYPIIYLKKSNKTYTHIPRFLIDKPLIILEPGGMKGIYTMGICSYLKKHYNLTNHLLNGASAGSWNGLFLSYKYDLGPFVNNILHDIPLNFSIYDIQIHFKKILLKYYTFEDFDFCNLYISVSHIKNNTMYTVIYSDFLNLEDVIDCCIASSNIPYITGIDNLYYNNEYSLDGGFFSNPYLDINETLRIYPSMWTIENYTKLERLKNNYNFLFYNEPYDYIQLYKKGYEDTKNNSFYLSTILKLHHLF